MSARTSQYAVESSSHLLRISWLTGRQQLMMSRQVTYAMNRMVDSTATVMAV